MYAAFNEHGICFCIYDQYVGVPTGNMRQITQEQYTIALENQAALGLNSDGNVRIRTQQELDDDAIAEQAAQDAIRDEKRRTDLLVIEFVNDPVHASDDARAEVARRLGVVS